MAITLPDSRSLPNAILEDLRRRALHACEAGFTETDIALILGLRRETVCQWWTAYRRGGLETLPKGRTGRPLGSRRLLDDTQAQRIRNLLDAHRPTDLGIAAPLWNRRAVAALVQKELGITLALRTVGSYLRRWGYTPQRPARKARQQDPQEVEQWLQQDYPRLVAKAQTEGADIYWCDEMGVGIDTFPGRGYAPAGHPPTKEVSGKRARVNAVSAINHRGKAHFMTFTGALDSAVFLAFLELLLRATRKKLYVVLDRLQAHIGAEVEAWVAAQGGRIELVPLPKYSPELNPVEYLNHDTKEEVNAEGLPSDAGELHDNLDGFLHQLAHWPKRIMHYFCHPAVRYAAVES